MTRAKKSAGNAYLLVIVATFAVLSISLTALAITAGSRDTTARYREFFGLYDLAVAGNEQAFLLIEQDEIFPTFQTHPYYGPTDGVYLHNWGIKLPFPNEEHIFRASTSIRARTEGYYIKTHVWRCVSPELCEKCVLPDCKARGCCTCVDIHDRCDTLSTGVRSRVNIIEVVDGFTVEMVELLRITD